MSQVLCWLLCPATPSENLCIIPTSSSLQSALRLKPTFTDAYNNMASALVQKGMIPAALQCYQSALQINPELVSTLPIMKLPPLNSSPCRA